MKVKFKCNELLLPGIFGCRWRHCIEDSFGCSVVVMFEVGLGADKIDRLPLTWPVNGTEQLDGVVFGLQQWVLRHRLDSMHYQVGLIDKPWKKSFNSRHTFPWSTRLRLRLRDIPIQRRTPPLQQPHFATASPRQDYGSSSPSSPVSQASSSTHMRLQTHVVFSGHSSLLQA